MSDIKPALTAEEWAEILANEEKVKRGYLPDCFGSGWSLEGGAAFTLRRAGWFTWADVDALLSTARGYESGDWGDVAEFAAPIRDLADRIAALLPPRKG